MTATADLAPALPPSAAAECEFTILMPCLNEARTVGICVAKALSFLRGQGIAGEVLVADNGGTDGSQEIAARSGARVIHVPQRGYGAALIAGINIARGGYIIMGDADDSYDFTALAPFVAELRNGNDLVMGNRFRGGIKPGAMPALHRYLGNPVLSGLGRIFFRAPCGDFHCGLRGFSREAIRSLDLQATGMEFASEMVVKAMLRHLRITEVPTTLSPDGRDRPPHLRSWRDGWRHLRFLLLYCPNWLFLWPGSSLTLAGAFGMAWLLPGPQRVGEIVFDIHTLAYAGMILNIGVQSLFFWAFARIYGARQGIVPPDPSTMAVLKALTIERGLALALFLLINGAVLGLLAVGQWGAEDFGAMPPQKTMRLIIPSATAILLAFQVAYGVFFLGFLGIRATARR